MLETNIKITPAGIFVEELDERGGKSFKEITLDDIQSVFEKTSIETPMLPTSCIYYNRSSGGNIWGGIFLIPPQKKAIHYTGRGSDAVFNIVAPIPYTMFGFVVRDGVIIHSYCTCVKYNPLENGDKHVTETSLLSEVERQNYGSGMSTPTFLFPYGNTWEDFRICWGNINLPTVDSPADIPNIIDKFFEGACNGDLFYTNSPLSFTDYMRNADGKETINNDDLFANNKTVQDFVNVIRRNMR